MSTSAELPLIAQAQPNPAWLSQWSEDILEPELPIVDPHHHLSDHWGGYYADQLAADVKTGHRVQATVFVQCGWAYRQDGPPALAPVGETEAVVAQAMTLNARDDGTRYCAGIVGYADLRLGAAVDEVLAAHVHAGQGRFRGIRCSAAQHEAFRHGVMTPPPPHLYMDSAFREGFARLAGFGLSFESWSFHNQLGELLDLARAFPATPIVINHLGAPLGVGPYAGRREQVWAEWQPTMRALSECPNVHVKLGALGMTIFGFDFHTRAQPPNSAELAAAWRPYVEASIELFGAERCMFESNFPVDKGTCSYPVLWNAFKRIAAHASPAEKAALFSKTASRFYRIDSAHE